MRDFKLPQPCKSDLRFFGILHSVGWYFVVMFRENLSVSSSRARQSLALQDKTDRFSRNVSKKLAIAQERKSHKHAYADGRCSFSTSVFLFVAVHVHW
jgi:hypothetical protein